MSEGKKHPRFSPALVLPAFVASPFGPPSAFLRPSFGHASARHGQDAVERPSRGRCGAVAISSGLARRSKNKRGATPLCYAALAFQPCLSRLSLVRDGQSFSAFAAAGGQHFSTVGGRHSLAETVLVGSFSQRGLECSLHIINIFCSFFRALRRPSCRKIEFAKVHKFFEL